MNRVLWIAAGAVAALIGIVVAFAYLQASNERVDLMSDLQYRTRVVADSLEEAITPSVRTQATSTVQKVISRIASNERIAGIAVFNSSGDVIANEKHVPDTPAAVSMIATAMDSAKPAGVMASGVEGTVYAYVTPLYDSQSSVIGALMVVQNASYIDETIGQIWWRNVQRILALTFLMLATIFGLVYWAFRRPILHMSQTLQAIRRGDTPDGVLPSEGFFAPLAHEISKVTTSLHQARTSASEEARMRLEKLDSPWTAARLQEFIKAHVKGRPIFVISNREPFIHSYDAKGKVTWTVPAGGLVTALGPVMEATGGTWIAHGSGGADKETADESGKLRVPPDEPRYTLKRVWLADEEVRGYYDGFANEALWPLCHMAHVRPMFRKEDWQQYRHVNVQFAKALLEEIRHVERPIVLVQDYHLALLPELIKKSRPDAQVAVFWHIPWPSAAQFSICPWRKELLEGMLGADLIGFHTQQYCNNFMDTVANEIESRIDFEHFSVYRDEHASFVKPFPISIAFPDAEKYVRQSGDMLKSLGIATERLLLGVDRIDYTKGILERFKGFEFFLREHPEYRNKVTLLQIAAPSRESVAKYREYGQQVAAEAERINRKFGTKEWQPIRYEHHSYSRADLAALYARADACLVTSLHDGMNLVAKEYVAARTNETGALILSSFTGASRDLKGALIVNPYSAEEVAAALRTALSMPATEQYRRMKLMRGAVRDYNVYRWSAEIIKTLTRLD